MEIERKFLVKELPDLSKYEVLHIEQGYISTSPTIRIRRENDEYYVTCKGKGSLSHDELNIPMSAEKYEHLLTKIDGILISKNRYLIPLSDKLTAELDEFLDSLEGLYYVEVEFETEKEALDFIPPTWFGKEVTYDKSYTNASLSKGVDPRKF